MRIHVWARRTTSLIMGSCFSAVTHHQRKKITPKVQQGTEPAASAVVPTCNPLTAVRLAVFGCGDFFFSTLRSVSAPFSLTPGISFCADTYPRSNLHETILLRQAFCALLNDGCLREMVIMMDSEP